jgi:hypothetical protein
MPQHNSILFKRQYFCVTAGTDPIADDLASFAGHLGQQTLGVFFGRYRLHVAVEEEDVQFFIDQKLLKLTCWGRGELVRQEVRQLQVGEATLQESCPLVIVGVGKVHLRDTICCQALIQVWVHLI